MVGRFRKFVRRFGFDIAPFPGTARHWEHIVELLDRHAVDHVLDVGANTGQYARALRGNGYGGPITSFEPLSVVQDELARSAAGDSLWVVAPRTAVGAAEGDIEINVSGESDMSSVLPLDETAHERLASTRTTARETVPVTTVEAAVREHAGTAARVFVKSDTQGYEAEVLDGIGDAWDRIAGLQLELSLQAIYEDQPDHLPLVARLAERGFRPHLIVPGYWSRHYGRMLEYDAVFFRD